MTERELFGLINQEIDGTNSAADKARLGEELRRNPEARNLLDELRNLAGALESTRPAAPPPGLKHAVMREVRSRTARHGFLKFQRPARWLGWLFRRPSYTFVSGFAVGIALLLLYLNLFPPHVIEPRDASGTILWSSPSVQRGELIDFSRFGVEGHLESHFSEDTGILFMQSDSEDLRVEFRYDPRELTLAGISRGDDFQGDMVLGEGRLVAEGVQGGVTMVFRSKAGTRGSVDVLVQSRGAQVFDGTISIRPDAGD